MIFFTKFVFLLIFQSYLAFGQNWYQSNGVLYNGNTPVILHGINWFGMETPDRAPSGLWTSNSKNGQTIGHSIAWFMGKIRDLGFNAVRIPLSPQSLSNNPNAFPPASWARTWDPSLTTGWLVLNSMLTQAQNAGLYVLIDYQTCNENQINNNLPGTPTGCPGYTLNDWINDLKTIAVLAKSYPNVLGIDIFNEPHGISWQTWQGYVEQALPTLYSSNPLIVYFVEGVDGYLPGESAYVCWGENLYYTGGSPVSPHGVPLNKIVYSPHIYGKCNSDWAKCFGYLQGYNLNTVIVGEFGYNSQNTTDTNVFMPNFLNYLNSDRITCFFYWCINSNDDTGLGYISSDDPNWCNLVGEKVNRFRSFGIYPQSYITSTNPPSLCN